MFLNLFHNFCTEDKITFVGFFQCLLFSRIRHEEPDRLQTASSSISHHICSVRLNVKVLFRFLFIKMVVVHLLHIFVCLCVFICLYLITGFSSSRCQNKARLKQNFAFCDFSREIVYSCLGSGIHFWSYSSFYFRHFHRESEKHLVQTCQDILAITNNM